MEREEQIHDGDDGGFHYDGDESDEEDGFF